MKKLFYILTIILFASCKQTNKNSDSEQQINIDSSQTSHAETNKTIKFLWRDKKYDNANKELYNFIVINEDYCKTISDPERAALGYVATFLGNECSWEGEYTDERSNLKCIILTALKLGYQCSKQHLGFLRQWFKNDPKTLAELTDSGCPTTPDSSTIQDTFDEITLTINGNNIYVIFKATGVNMRENKSWSWTETDHFHVDKDNIKLIKKEESKVKQEQLEAEE